MKDRINKLITRTLLYSDIFNYPLSEEEVWEYLISDGKVDRKNFQASVRKINSVVLKKGKFLYIKGRDRNVSLRKERSVISRKKLKVAEEISEKISFLPSILLIGVSGNVSMLNAQRRDDIDFFVITRKNTVWSTRLFIILILKAFGKHRKKDEEDVSNKICLNMLVDEENISIPKSRRSLYTAHEVAQLMPLFERQNAYTKFVWENRWITQFMPNIYHELGKRRVRKINPETLDLPAILLTKLLEYPSKIFQKMIIKRHLTKEVIRDGFLAFHPKDYGRVILSKYKKNLVQYGVK